MLSAHGLGICCNTLRRPRDSAAQVLFQLWLLKVETIFKVPGAGPAFSQTTPFIPTIVPWNIKG